MLGIPPLCNAKQCNTCLADDYIPSSAHKQTRVNILGPIIEQTDNSETTTSTVRPLWVHFYDKNEQIREGHAFYPFLNAFQSPHSDAVNVFNIVHYYRSYEMDGCIREKKFDILPFYTSRRTGNPKTSYEGIFPFAGGVRNFLGVDAATWSWFPLFFAIQRDDTIRYGLPWPFIRWQRGPCSGGAALWPLAGSFWKKDRYHHRYILWPFIYHNKDDLDKPVPSVRTGVLPFFAYESTEKKTMKTVAWPFFSDVKIKDPCYHEIQFPWPIFVQGRGEKQYTNRWAPFYTHSIRKGVEKRWFLWPLIKERRWEEAGLAIDQQQFLYFLIWRQKQYSLANPHLPPAEKTHLWPLYSYWDNGAGRKQFQFLSPFEVFFPTNRAIRKAYTPLFALYRYSQDRPGHSRHTFLFDLIDIEKTPTSKHLALGPIFEFQSDPEFSRVQILKGLLGLQKKNGKKSLRLLWMTI